MLIDLSRVCAVDVRSVGSKAATLGQLRAAGWPVPAGFCVPVGEAFRGSNERLHRTLITAAQHLLSTSPFLAARSSAVAEDLTSASFAGQYQSVIGIADAEGLIAAVDQVWRSFAAPQAVASRAELGLRDADTGMGVLVQPVIEAEVSGVCFSRDPVAPETGCVVINAVWGLGAGVVDGALPADTLRLDRDTLSLVKHRVVEKTEQFVVRPEGGLVRAPIPEVQRRAECLPEAWAKRIAGFALAAEQTFGRPQDMEWAIAGGQVWILQSRPIASLSRGPWAQSPAFPVIWQPESDARRFWTRSLIERQRKQPLLPLDIDYIRLMESNRVETCLAVGADRNEDIRVLNGQVYHSPAPLPITPADRRIREQAYRNLQSRLASEGRTAWDHWGPEIERANQRLRAVDTIALDGPGLADFLEAAMAARSRHNMLHPMIWFKPLQPYFDAFAALTGMTGTTAEAAAYRYVDGAESPLDRLIDGLNDLAVQARAIPAVAAWMRAVAGAEAETGAKEVERSAAGDLAIPLAKDPPDALAETGEFAWNAVTDAPAMEADRGAAPEWLANYPSDAPGAEAWMARFQAYLAEFGDRNGSGYGSDSLVSTPTWRDQPRQVIRLAASFLDPQVEYPAVQRERSRRALDVEVEALCARSPDPQTAAAFREQLDYARRCQAVVELHNHHIEQVGLGQLRRAVMAAAGCILANGFLQALEDVFWLTFTEILAALRSRGPGSSLPEMIAARKVDYQAWARLDPPLHLGLPPAALPPRPPFTDDVTPLPDMEPGKIRGVGASPGQVRARARVVRDFEDLPVLSPGDILVAQNAGPLWMPFFPILGGVVLEGGSLGQHAASTAREYGIPAVIEACGATVLIPDGAWIEIDGAAGLIEVAESQD